MAAWQDQIFRNTVIGILIFILTIAVALFPFRKKSLSLKTSWASLTSWAILAPALCAVLAFGQPWPTIGFSILSLWACREFFRITGMYHMVSFVWCTYFFIILSAFSIYVEAKNIYNLMPMLYLGIISLIPLFKNEYKNMLQYVALSLMAYIFTGWSFLHLAMIAKNIDGAKHVIYIMILTEFFDTVILTWSKLYGKYFWFDKVAPRRSVEGFWLGFVLTLTLAWAMRHLLPNSEPIYWITAGSIAVLVGGLGDITLSVFRRDLGVKDVGAFIIGRGGIMDRMDRLIYVAPIYYYSLEILEVVVQ